MCNADFHLTCETNGAGEEIGSGNLKRRQLYNFGRYEYGLAWTEREKGGNCSSWS